MMMDLSAHEPLCLPGALDNGLDPFRVAERLFVSEFLEGCNEIVEILKQLGLSLHDYRSARPADPPIDLHNKMHDEMCILPTPIYHNLGLM